VIEHRVEIWRHLVDRVIILAPGGGVLADGHPESVLTERGAELAASGVWVPAFPPRYPVRSSRSSDRSVPRSTPLLSACDLGIARVPHRLVAENLTLSLDAGTTTAITGPNEFRQVDCSNPCRA
jgi:energy-coupling factor transport system ATP-binding protein